MGQQVFQYKNETSKIPLYQCAGRCDAENLNCNLKLRSTVFNYVVNCSVHQCVFHSTFTVVVYCAHNVPIPPTPCPNNVLTCIYNERYAVQYLQSTS